MGFFGKLFEKKVCDICGGEIGLLGNRKLEDGNMCKACAKKLSPWFSDRRESTVEQINGQLRYREENRSRLQTFRADRILGDYYKMYIEEQNGIPFRFCVTEDRDFVEANPDIIQFSDVATCITDIVENRREQYQTVDGKSVSYDPPKYETTYQFFIDMNIRNNPYFDNIRFQVHSYPIRITTRESAVAGRTLARSILGVSGSGEPTYDRHYREAKNLCQQIEQLVAEGKRVSEIQAPPQFVQETPAFVPAPAPAPAGPKFCTGCGAPADGGKFCQFCGTKLQ